MHEIANSVYFPKNMFVELSHELIIYDKNRLHIYNPNPRFPMIQIRLYISNIDFVTFKLHGLESDHFLWMQQIWTWKLKLSLSTCLNTGLQLHVLIVGLRMRQADHGYDMSLKCKKIKHDTRITLSLWKQLYNYLLTLIVINRVSQQA